MKFRIAILALLITPLAAYADPPSKDQLLQNIYELRSRLDREREQRENEARANMASVIAAGADSPTVTEMRREMGYALSQIQNNYRCLDLDVENNGGNTVIVCGNNNGGIHGENTKVGGSMIGTINTLLSAGGTPGAVGGGSGGVVALGAQGDTVVNTGLYMESNSNRATNSSVVEGDVNGQFVQSNTQANGNIGDRTAIVEN